MAYRGFQFIVFSISLTVATLSSCAQPLHGPGKPTSQDSLRGSITPERAWWDVIAYNIYVHPDYRSKMIRGWNQVSFRALSDGHGREMQIDLQQPMQIDSVVFEGKKLAAPKRNGNVYYLDFGKYKFASHKSKLASSTTATDYSVKIFFSGKPREAVNPPWDGGWIFSKDKNGRPWMTVACQGLGASVWYPCKDHQSDEPNMGAMLQVRVPDSLVAVANGKLYAKDAQGDGTTLYTWQVKNPINNYNIVPYIGDYVHFEDLYTGKDGRALSLDYWVMRYSLEKAKKQFGRDVKPMLTCFEDWFGPYPFYEDGFKLVETPHLGMEHQSAIAYGNNYKDGYLGMDLSGTGWGRTWDYIIIHEAGHEWYGNNITTNDIADMWVHEGFTMYSEVLYVECQHGARAADEYLAGLRRNISNDIPLIGPYGINQEGSGDMYNKGANIIHTIRAIINDEKLFKEILRGMNRDFYHQTVDSRDIEKYISDKSGIDFSRVFDQYLRTTDIPVLEYKIEGDNLHFAWVARTSGFNMPVQLETGEWLYPTDAWKVMPLSEAMKDKGIKPGIRFYIKARKLN
jgi:aminopeptidase N